VGEELGNVEDQVVGAAGLQLLKLQLLFGGAATTQKFTASRLQKLAR